MNLIDAHCHLADPKLRAETRLVLERAALAGVGAVIAVGAIGTIETDRITVDIAEHHKNVFAAIGVHPHDAKDCDQSRLDQLRELARSEKVVAIGETGLDFHYMHSPSESQESALRAHLKLAAELDLPIVIHCRGAEERVTAIVGETGMPPAGGQIHCFTGDAQAAASFVALGFHISFSGIVTFKNAARLREAARIVPDNRILIETDSPYLAPEPNRGKRNEPGFVALTLAALARVREVDENRLSEAVFENANRLFRLGLL
jgi:TatD DNase family protein